MRVLYHLSMYTINVEYYNEVSSTYHSNCVLWNAHEQEEIYHIIKPPFCGIGERVQALYFSESEALGKITPVLDITIEKYHWNFINNWHKSEFHIQ